MKPAFCSIALLPVMLFSCQESAPSQAAEGGGRSSEAGVVTNTGEGGVAPTPAGGQEMTVGVSKSSGGTSSDAENPGPSASGGSAGAGEFPRPLQARRLNEGAPIIDAALLLAAGLEASEAENINGPSLVRVPQWLGAQERVHPEAEYYLYFASHTGRWIRMAWAKTLDGPWSLHNVTDGDDGLGVLDNRSPIVFVDDSELKPSDCASPDVVVDDENERFLLFFHVNTSTGVPATVSGDKWFDTGAQVSYVATSRTGLNFNGGDQVKTGLEGEPGTDGAGHGFGVKSQALSNAYLRTFVVNGRWYGFTNYGPIWQGPSLSEQAWSSPWTHERWESGVVAGGGNPVWSNLVANFAQAGATAPRWYAGFDGSEESPYGENEPRTGAPRHFGVRWLTEGQSLEVYYTSRGEKPESIYRTTMNTSASDYRDWSTSVLSPDPEGLVHELVLRPEMAWEGAELPLTVSKNGAESGVNGLRDPYVFTDRDGAVYLLYSGGPEQGIGLAALE